MKQPNGKYSVVNSSNGIPIKNGCNLSKSVAEEMREEITRRICKRKFSKIDKKRTNLTLKKAPKKKKE